METENNKSNIIEISELNKWYGDFHALKNINMSVKEGEIIVVCGPSGSGKSTLILQTLYNALNLTYKVCQFP